MLKKLKQKVNNNNYKRNVRPATLPEHRCNSCPAAFLTQRAMVRHEIKNHALTASTNTTAVGSTKISPSSQTPLAAGSKAAIIQTTTAPVITAAPITTAASNKTYPSQIITAANKTPSRDPTISATPTMTSASNTSSAVTSLTNSEAIANSPAYLPKNTPAVPAKMPNNILKLASGNKINANPLPSPYLLTGSNAQSFDPKFKRPKLAAPKLTSSIGALQPATTKLYGKPATQISPHFNKNNLIGSRTVQNSVTQKIFGKLGINAPRITLKNCRYCKLSFVSTLDLLKHEHNHSQSDKDNYFKNTPNLYNNNNSTNGSQVFMKPIIPLSTKPTKAVYCDICGTRHSNYMNMLGHKTLVHFDKYNEADKGWKCTFCSSYFVSEQVLLTHIVKDHDTLGPNLSMKTKMIK